VKRSKSLTVLGQADHVVDLRLGGVDRPSRSKYPSEEIARDAKIPVEPSRRQQLIDGTNHAEYVAARRMRALMGTWEPKNGVPTTRADCPTDREQVGCPFYRCRHHLWVWPPAGRPNLQDVPRDEQGLTIRTLGKLGEAGDRLDLEPRWLQHPLPPSCSLDLADKPHGLDEVGAATDRHRTLVGHVLRAGIASMKAKGQTSADLVRVSEADRRVDEEPSLVTRGRRGTRT
jgi:hypothetical protein